MSSGSRFRNALLPALLLLAVPTFAQQRRINGRIDNAARITLRGQIHPRATLANDTGRVSPSLQLPYVTLQFAQTDAQKADLTTLLAAQQDPKSPSYHQWLIPAQYADRFGLSADDLNSVRTWLENQGLLVVGVAQCRDWIAVSGDAAHFEAAFKTELHNYTVSGAMHFANATDPSIPAALNGVVAAIRGLNNFKLKPQNVTAKYTKQTSGHHYMAPNDFATIYDIAPAYAAGIDGSGQTVVVAGQVDLTLTDVQTFRSQWNLPDNPPKTLLVPGSPDPGYNSGDGGESLLDVEWAGAVARNATILFVYSNDVITSIQYAIDHALGSVLSLSYGSCELENLPSEAALLRTYAQKANSEGITWVNATGDNGAPDCGDSQHPGLSVDMPASIPEITGVGGTTFSEGTGQYWNSTNDANGASVLAYIPETTWNDSALDNSPAAGGGGASVFFTRPAWQTGPGVPLDNARHVPDIAMASSADHDAYLVYLEGAIGAFGGTSAPTPAVAGVLALLNQYLISTGQQQSAGLGNVNVNLYQLAQSAPSIFHDITTGDNIVSIQSCSRRTCVNNPPVGFTAGPGYDQATGLGSTDVWKLMNCWSGVCKSTAPASQISGLTDAAAFQQSYSPGMIMAVFGSQLSPATVSAATVPLPLSLAGVSATVNGEAAPLYYASSTQLNIQIPWDTPAGPATLAVNNSGNTVSQTFTVSSASPGIFTDGNRQIVPSASATRNQITSLYLTGSGAVSPSIATGAAPGTNIPLTSLPAPQNVTVTVGGVPASTSCAYCFVGIPYGLVGVTQINFLISPDTPLGLQPVVVSINGVASPAANINITN